MYKSVIKVILLGCLLVNTASVFAEYIKVSNSGKSLPSSARLGIGVDDWACTYDTKKRLLWEVKTDDGQIRDKDWAYIWYNPSSTGVKGDEQNDYYSANCEKGGFCNTDDYKNRVNRTRLCGANTWSVPNLTQLKSLIYCSNTDATGKTCTGDFQYPTINTTFFPNTIAAEHWTISELKHNPPFAWFVTFKYGYDSGDYKRYAKAVRLVVRGGEVFKPVLGAGNPDPAPTPGFDSEPDDFDFINKAGVARNTVFVSDLITVSGINTGTNVSIIGGEYRINNGFWVDYETIISVGDRIEVRHTSSDNFGQSVITTLTIGGVSGQFTSTTLVNDTTLDEFSFNAQGSVQPDTAITSNSIVVAGISENVDISIDNGEYRVNDEPWTSEDGSVTEGDSVRVQHTSSKNSVTQVVSTLTIDGVSEKFISTTKVVAGNGTPREVSFDDISERKTKADAVIVEDAGFISGHIYDACNGEPIGLAELNFNGSSIVSELSAATGSYSAELTQGEYTVTTNGSNYEEDSFNIVIAKGITSLTDISMLPSSEGCAEEAVIGTSYKAIMLAGAGELAPSGDMDPGTEVVSPVNGLDSQYETSLMVVLRESMPEQRIWASILPPIDSYSENTAIDDLLQVELDCKEGICEGSYNNFSINGTYQINFFAEDNTGKASLLREIEVEQTKADPMANSAAIIYQVRNELLSLKDVELDGKHYWIEMHNKGGLKFEVKNYFLLPELVSQQPVILSDDGMLLSLPRVYLYDSNQYISIDLMNIGGFVFEAQLETLKYVE